MLHSGATSPVCWVVKKKTFCFPATAVYKEGPRRCVCVCACVHNEGTCVHDVCTVQTTLLQQRSAGQRNPIPVPKAALTFMPLLRPSDRVIGPCMM